MKMRWLLLFLLLPLPVLAVSYDIRENLVMGDISTNATVLCERAKSTGFVHLQKELPCCIDQDSNGYCNNIEPLLGSGHKMGLSMTYWWPTSTFKPSFSHKLMVVPCEGTVVITGDEYADFLAASNCSKVGQISYCCAEDVFAQVIPPKITGSFHKTPVSTNDNLVYVINKNKWDLGKKNERYRDKFMKKAMRTEETRCSEGGGDLFLWDEAYGGYFSNTRNYHPGERVFLFTKPDYDITPLITWCD